MANSSPLLPLGGFEEVTESGFTVPGRTGSAATGAGSTAANNDAAWVKKRRIIVAAGVAVALIVAVVIGSVVADRSGKGTGTEGNKADGHVKPGSAPLAGDSTCGPPGAVASSVPDCNKPDFGSCGNACCVVEFNITSGASTSEDAYQRLKQWLQTGGSDGSVAYVTGADAAGHNPGDDCREYHNGYDFVLQGSHTTTKGFVDTLDFNIKTPSTKGGAITLRAASISGIHGALGDNGQNFKTLSYIVGQLQPQLSKSDVRVVYGCGQA